MELTETIISNLVLNEKFTRKTLPFLKAEYFPEKSDSTLFNLINDYTLKYNAAPTKEALKIELDSLNGITEDLYSEIDLKINALEIDEKTNVDYLINKTEEFCKDRALYNAILESISIIDKKGQSNLGVGAIPTLLSTALAVSFDTNIGHDYTSNFDERYEFYHQKEARIPFDIEYLNKITRGGGKRKTLNLLMSSRTGGGKSLTMCHMAAANLVQGLNVLYITLEMAEEEISKRIDANLMNISMDDIEKIPKDIWDKKAKEVKSKSKGKLIVKQYPTSTAHSGHFRHLCEELRIKQNFIPDVIYVDYINICASARVKLSGGVNTNTFIKTISEELRGLAVELNVMMWSATQGNRGAVSSSDVDIDDISDSIGLASTVDLMIAIITSEELDELGQFLFKQLKNRYGPLDKFRRFVVGVDKDFMRLYDVSESAQKSFTNAKDSGNDKSENDIFKPSAQKAKRSFEDFG